MTNIARNISTLEDTQVDHQYTMIKVEGKIWNNFVSILIYLKVSLS